jgi:catalase
VRDVRGWSTKFYTEDGNQDFVFNDLPVFFLRDPIKFPSMNRSHKKHPRTNVPDNTMFWDYHVNNPEGIHALVHLFGQRGIPASLRHINGYGVHTYTLTKGDGSFVYVKWHWKPEGGIKTLDSETATKLAGTDPDHHVKDLYNAIERGDYPTWLLYIQVMKPQEVDSAPFDIFDDTFTWPHAQYPLRRVGRLTLDRNVSIPGTLFAELQLTLGSPTIISRTSNKPRSRHLTWFRALLRPQTWVRSESLIQLSDHVANKREQSCRRGCSHIRMLPAIV